MWLPQAHIFLRGIKSWDVWKLPLETLSLTVITCSSRFSFKRRALLSQVSYWLLLGVAQCRLQNKPRGLSMFRSSGTAGWLFSLSLRRGGFGQGKPVTTHPARGETPQAGPHSAPGLQPVMQRLSGLRKWLWRGSTIIAVGEQPFSYLGEFSPPESPPRLSYLGESPPAVTGRWTQHACPASASV